MSIMTAVDERYGQDDEGRTASTKKQLEGAKGRAMSGTSMSGTGAG